MSTISVSNLGKAYKQYPNRWARLAEWLDPYSQPRHHLRWVLQDINFTVQPGEAVGIVGINGAGKSTLLKMITGTTQPTTGSVDITGRVAALLELGMGFHPDFTGRQNAFMAGQLLGHSVEEIASLMHEIEAFADIGDYIDQPVRVYSSGMQVRLAFSVATVVRPEILIVDEALAVGDAAFQRKCHRRIESYIESGTSLLFVSHDIEGVKRICSKAIYLNAGRIVEFGESKMVCEAYEVRLFGGENKKMEVEGNSLESFEEIVPEISSEIDSSLVGEQGLVYGTGGAYISGVRIENSAGKKLNVLLQGETVVIRYRVTFDVTLCNPVFTINIKTVDGVSVYGTHTRLLKKTVEVVEAGDMLDVSFSMKCILNPGFYFLNCAVLPFDLSEFLQRKVDVLAFRVLCDDSEERFGLVNLEAEVEIDAYLP